MAINGDHAIYRLTTVGLNSETLVSDKIEFDGTGIVPDAKSHIVSIKPVFNAINTDNPNPGSQDSPNSQDTGNAPFILEIKGYFYEASSAAAGIQTFINWMVAAKVVKTEYPKGRFGFRSNTRSDINVLPQKGATAGGFQLINFELEDVQEYNSIPFIATLKFVGDMSIIGA